MSYQEKDKVGSLRKIGLNGSSEDEFSLNVDLSKVEKQGKTNQKQPAGYILCFKLLFWFFDIL